MDSMQADTCIVYKHLEINAYGLNSNSNLNWMNEEGTFHSCFQPTIHYRYSLNLI